LRFEASGRWARYDEPDVLQRGGVGASCSARLGEAAVLGRGYEVIGDNLPAAWPQDRPLPASLRDRPRPGVEELRAELDRVAALAERWADDPDPAVEAYGLAVFAAMNGD
jgi:hypothetical protein